MSERKEIEEIFSKSVRAGRRTYFFDVRSTRANDYYLTITESKRDFHEDGTPFYKKHKIYLYKEDFKDFELWKLIINQKVYDELVEARKTTSTSFFPKYRFLDKTQL